MAPLSSILGGQVTTWSSETLVRARFLDPHPPRRGPPLTAHHQQQDDQQRGHEHQQGQPHVVPHLGSWRVDAGSAAGGGAAGRHGWRAPEGSAPRGRDWAVRGRADRRGGGAGPQTCPPSRGDRVSGGAGREAPLPPHRSGEPGPRRAEAGGERTRRHGGHRRGKREPGVARRPQGPGGGSRELPTALGDARSQPLPEAAAAAAAPPLPAPSPAAAHHQAPSLQRLRRCAGPAGKWSAKLRTSCWSPPNKELQLPGLSTAQGFALLSPFSVPCAFGVLEPPPLKTAG